MTFRNIIKLLILFLISSCESTKITTTKMLHNCQSNQDCVYGYCRQGLCSLMSYQCSSNMDCPNGRCVSGECFENQCVDGEKKPCSSICGMGEALCIGGVWRSCNALMPSMMGCTNQKDIDMSIQTISMDMNTHDIQKNDIYTPVSDMQISLIEDIYIPLDCEWMSESQNLPLSSGMLELGLSHLLFHQQNYLAYFGEINFVNFTSVIETTFLSTINQNHQIDLATSISDGLPQDVKVIGTSIITASISNDQVIFKKFDQNLNLIATKLEILNGIQNLKIVALGNDYGIIWTSDSHQLNVDRLSLDFSQFESVEKVGLILPTYDLNVIQGTAGIVVAFYQSNRDIQELKVLGLDLQGNLNKAVKQIGIGQSPVLQIIESDYFVVFINEEQKISLIKLDQNLEILLPQITLQSQDQHTSPSAAVMGNFLYYTWQTKGDTSNIWLGEIDRNGQERIAPIQITMDSDNGVSHIAIKDQDEFMISWHHRISPFSSKLFAQKWRIICQ
jgi:hypothetical protein